MIGEAAAGYVFQALSALANAHVFLPAVPCPMAQTP